jgi:hypothetical protein
MTVEHGEERHLAAAAERRSHGTGQVAFRNVRVW